VFEVTRLTIIDKVNSKETYRETDQYPTWSETSVAQYSRRTWQLLSDDGTNIFWAINKKYYKNALWICHKNGLARPLSVQQGRSCWRWLRNFMCRHPRTRLRIFQVTSAARVKGFTKINVAKFFNIFEPMLRLIDFSPSRLFNYEKRVLLSFCRKGFTRESCCLQECYCSYVPPLLVFPRNNMTPELLDSRPPGSVAACHKARWILKDNFRQRLK